MTTAPKTLPFRKRRCLVKSVRFNEASNTIRRRSVAPANDTWMQDADYDAIRHENRQVLQAVRHATLTGSNKALEGHCIRGLETLIALHVLGNRPAQATRLLLLSSKDEERSKFSALLSQSDTRKALQKAQLDALQCQGWEYGRSPSSYVWGFLES